VLDSEFFHKPWRENTGGKGSTKDLRELCIKTSNTNIFEFKVGLYDGISCWSPIGTHDRDRGFYIFVERDVGMGKDALVGRIRGCGHAG